MQFSQFALQVKLTQQIKMPYKHDVCSRGYCHHISNNELLSSSKKLSYHAGTTRICTPFCLQRSWTAVVVFCTRLLLNLHLLHCSTTWCINSTCRATTYNTETQRKNNKPQRTFNCIHLSPIRYTAFTLELACRWGIFKHGLTRLSAFGVPSLTSSTYGYESCIW